MLANLATVIPLQFPPLGYGGGHEAQCTPTTQGASSFLRDAFSALAVMLLPSPAQGQESGALVHVSIFKRCGPKGQYVVVEDGKFGVCNCIQCEA